MDRQPLPTFSHADRRTWSWHTCAGLALVLLVAAGLFSLLTQPASARPLSAVTRTVTRTPTRTPTPLDHIVISQFRSKGTAGANDEYIELFNPMDTATPPVDISGWQVKGSDNNGTTFILASIPTEDNVLLYPGQHYLIANDDFSGIETVVPDRLYDNRSTQIPDDGGIALLDASGTTTPVDAVGMSTGSAYLEGSTPLPTLPGSFHDYSYQRNPGGVFGACNDTNNNKNDFHVIVTSNPQNSDTIDDPCSVSLAYTSTPTATRTPTPSRTPLPGAVIINEVAWAGTSASANDEWIELYNPGGTDIDLTGWRLYGAKDGVPNIALGVGTGARNHSISAHGFFLLERTDDTTISDIPADQIYTGALSNAGEILFLKDPSGHRVDSANINGGPWPAGDAKTRCSMERRSPSMSDSNEAWLTNDNIHKNGHDSAGNPICGSPDKPNWASHVTPPPTAKPSLTPTRKPTRTWTPSPAPIVVAVIVINEFLAQPRSDWNHDGKVDSGDQFIEIKNLSPFAVSLSGYRLDDQEGDSTPYSFPSTSIQPGARLVFYGSDTHILLGGGGDSVRLFKYGVINDAFTYTLPPIPDQSWCRLPDGYGDWSNGCLPTPLETNKLATTSIVDQVPQSKFCLSKTILPEVYQAECLPSGLDSWSRSSWQGELQSQYPLYIHQYEQLYVIE